MVEIEELLLHGLMRILESHTLFIIFHLSYLNGHHQGSLSQIGVYSGMVQMKEILENMPIRFFFTIHVGCLRHKRIT